MADAVLQLVVILFSISYHFQFFFLTPSLPSCPALIPSQSLLISRPFARDETNLLNCRTPAQCLWRVEAFKEKMKKERRKVSVLKSTCFSRFSFFYFSSSCDRLLLLLFTTCHRHITSFISCNVFVFFVVRFSSSEDHFKTKAETCHPIRSSGTQPKFNLSFFLMLRISSYSLNTELSHISLQFQLNSINSCT